MIIYFVTSQKLLSRFIRWVLPDMASHVIIYFPRNGRVFHSSLFGVEKTTWERMEKDYTVIYSFEPKDVDQNAVHTRLKQYASRRFKAGYDYGAFLFFGFSCLFHRLFGVKIPAKNPWGSRGAYLCTEFAAAVLGIDETVDMLRPTDFYHLLENKKADVLNRPF